MLTKYSVEIKDEAIENHLKKLLNQIYKLLPSREEFADWQKLLSTIVIEFSGMCQILPDAHNLLFPLLCKLEGLFTLTEEDDFLLFRKTIFECLNIVSELKEYVSK